MIDETTGKEVIEIDGKTVPITAILRNAVRSPAYRRDVEVLTGDCYADFLGRFEDGSRIHTSFLIKEVAPDVFLTRSNNLYRVESWLPVTQS